MKACFSVLLLALPLSLMAQVATSEKVDEKFGGYFLDMEQTQKNMNVTLSSAIKLQRNLRQCLQEKSASYFRARQATYLNDCLALVNKSPAPKAEVQAPGLTVVFDMDETLITQWNRVSVQNPERTTFQVKNLDVVISESKGEVTLAPKGVTVRPGVMEMLKSLTAHARIGRIYFFSAREDKSAQEITNYFIQKIPSLKSKFGGLFARNSLRLDVTTVPSKDLRLLSPSLRNIVLVDDNPGRVMQKDLNFWIPKFNADLYLDAVASKDKNVLEANNTVAPYVTALLIKVADGMNFVPFSNETAEKNKINWGRKILELAGTPAGVIEDLEKAQIFDQAFFGGATIRP